MKSSFLSGLSGVIIPDSSNSIFKGLGGRILAGGGGNKAGNLGCDEAVRGPVCVVKDLGTHSAGDMPRVETDTSQALWGRSLQQEEAEHAFQRHKWRPEGSLTCLSVGPVKGC